MFTTLLLAATLAAPMSIHPTTLRCEYLTNPLGIDETAPRLSWIVESSKRGEKQTAYQIVASASAEEVKSGKGSLWETGKIASDLSAHIVYAGKKLTSGQRVWWRVRVWDKGGKVSAWSQPAFWEIGKLKPSDWQAQWVGAPTPKETTENISDIKWVWYPEGNPLQGAPAATRYFRYEFELPAGKKVRSAIFGAAADNFYVGFVNGTQVVSEGGWQSIVSANVLPNLKPGKNVIAVQVTNADGPAGMIARLQVEFDDDTKLRVVSNEAWSSGTMPTPGWNRVGLTDSDWKPALVIAKIGDAPWGTPQVGGSVPPNPYLRKTFQTNGKIKDARLYVTALGLYQFHINGKRVGKDWLTPGWTDYTKRLQYQVYDVTNLVKAGENALGAVLGDGWYAGYVGFGQKREHYGKAPRLMAQLELHYTDGSKDTILTDSSWKSNLGPIRGSDMLMGETYDARMEMPGWNTANYDDSKWQRVQVEQSQPNNHLPAYLPKAILCGMSGPTVQHLDTLKAKTVKESKGSWIFDMGQNMVGWVKLKVRGEAGKEVRIRFAEMLNKDGSIYVTNLRSARSTDTYILKGGGEEVYEPTFTFHGFRYVELTGYPGQPPLDAVTGIVVYSAAPTTGTFECSNPMVNKLQSNIFWGMRGNYLEVPTDCPQRDERLGWLGDAQVFVRTGCFNMDISAFMTKWMKDVVDGQSDAGGFPDVAPRLVDPADGAPAWGNAGVIVPWTIYLSYGDKRILERNYAPMAKWIEYIRSANPDHIWKNRVNNNFGDWLSINADTPKDVLSTAYYAYDVWIMAKTATLLGNKTDAMMYADLFEKIKAAFNKEFVSADGTIKGNTQTCYLLALRFGLLPEPLRPLAAAKLVKDIKDRNWHLSTGFVGVGYLTPTLTRNGYLDVAYRLLTNDTYPSWGYSIKLGATTIWERWDGYTEEKGFQDPGMNSFNHYSLGSVGEWMYSDVAGIDLDMDIPGYKHIRFYPRPGGGLTYAKATFDSLYGKILSHWRLEGGKFHYNITVPANTTATVVIPTDKPNSVKEGGKPIAKVPEVKFLRTEQGASVYQVGAGTYQFEAEASGK